MRHHLASGGDGIRSGLGLSLCQTLGTDLKDSLPAAVSLELVHQTSLVSDDIRDLSPTRNIHPAPREKQRMEKYLTPGLVLSVCTRIFLTEPTGTSLPLRMRHPDARNPG